MIARASPDSAPHTTGTGARLEDEPRPGRLSPPEHLPAAPHRAHGELPVDHERLLVVHCVDGLGVGGTELNAVRTVEALDRSRYEVHLVTFATDGPLRARYEALGVPIHSFPVPNLYGRAAIRQGIRLTRLLRELRPRVVHSHDCYDNVFATVCARLAGVPLVIASRRWWSALPRRVYAVGNRLAYRHVAHLVLANSPSVARLVHEAEGVDEERIVVVPNFLEPEAFERPSVEERAAARRALGVPDESFVIGCVAKLRPEKDHSSLLRALASLRDDHPDAHLVLVGDGPHETELRSLATQLGLDDRVRFAGYLPNRPNPHAWFDVSVLCSLHEGFPNSVIEAMAAARPIVATAVGGIPDVIVDGETGLLVPPADPARLSAAISRLRTDDALRHRLGEAALDRVEREHSRDQVIAGLEELYHRALSSRKHA